MKGLRRTLSDLSKMNARFDRLMSAAAGSDRLKSSTHLEPVEGFGSNPGNLRMLVHVPSELADGAPLVVALHGCTQTASDYDHGSGWSALASDFGFAVVFPEQQRSNNPNNCFNWFLPSDTARGVGEALSIAQMTEHMTTRYGIDRRRVFVVGLSAGGAMSAAMLAAYPDVFAGGAIIAGLPHGVAVNVQEALQTMARARQRSPREWGDLVRTASPHRGPWPRVSLWHGSADPIVAPQNMEEALKQWIEVHEVSERPDIEHSASQSTRRVWSNPAGDDVIEAISVDGMAHGVPIGTVGGHTYGNAGAFHFDVGTSSTQHIANFWGIADELFVPADDARCEIIAPTAPARAQSIPMTARAVATAGERAQRAEFAHDPRSHIAAALKAAGLLGKPPAGRGSLDPRKVIESTLRSVGLLKD